MDAKVGATGPAGASDPYGSLLTIPDSAWHYLFVQRGSLDKLKNNKFRWQQEYESGLHRALVSMSPFIASLVRCERVLDIGSGLGGIDVLIHQLTKAKIYLLDGVADKPQMHLHAETFNDMRVAQEFLKANGVELSGYYAPDLVPTFIHTGPNQVGPIDVDRELAEQFDLVISMGAWCFHLPPSMYLDFVLRKLRRGGLMIVNMRADKKEWFKELNRAPLKFIGNAGSGTKFIRQVYERV